MRILKIILFLPFLACLTVAKGQDFPEPSRTLVTDFTSTLTSAERQQLENKLVAFDDTTSTQIAVVVMQSTGGYDIADYGVRLAQKWGIGSEKNDNGILLLVALGDRAVTIQTGYGVEGAVPDIIAYRIIENEIKPAFRNENYYEGIDRATDALISYTKGEYQDRRQANSETGVPAALILIVIVIVIIVIIGKNRGDNDGEVMGGKGSSDLFWLLLLGQMGNKGRSGRGGYGGFGGGRGGFGGGGGGFGGFGGGGFGGGGASGRW